MLAYTKKETNFLATILTIIMIIVFISIYKLTNKSSENTYYFDQNVLTNIEEEKSEARKVEDILILAKKKKEHNKHNENENIYEWVSYLKEETNISKENSNKQINQQKEKKEKKINFYKTNSWRIKIPCLKLDAPISEGTSQESLRRTVGHFENTSIWNGNVALAAHNRGYKCNFFSEIKKLKKGDIIIYSTKQGERFYQVVFNKVIKETDWSNLKETSDNRITLITCEENRKEYRRCVQGIEIKVKKEEGKI